jgi:hypothetical protein
MNPQNNSVPTDANPTSDPGQDGIPMPVTNTQVPPVNNATAQNAAVNTPSVPAPQNVPSQAKSPHSPTIADDNDLIEKEWINKAKLIVAKTRDDPREQSKELFKYKADYIKKRYNKDIKVSDT